MKYEYITRIENAAAESSYIFEEINFNTHLPTYHGTSSSQKKTPFGKKAKVKTTQKPSTAERYKGIPLKTMIDIYRLYYLDFVVFGFSADSVLEIIKPDRKPPTLDFSNQQIEEVRRQLMTKVSAQNVVWSSETYSFMPREQYDNCDNLILQ